MSIITEYRVIIFLGIYVSLFLLENYMSARHNFNRLERLKTNWMISITNTAIMFVLGLFFPLLLFGIALKVDSVSFGVFNQISIPLVLEIIISIIALDFIIWLQHLATHKNNFLWRFHKVHHSDNEMDVSTAIRFHPIEIVFSFFVKLVCVIVLGIAPISIILFEIILSSFALMTHANILLSKNLDTTIGKIFITPSMHVIHHSPNRDYHDNNYGFCLSIWDRLFKTYIPSFSVNPNGTGIEGYNQNDNYYLKNMKLPFSS